MRGSQIGCHFYFGRVAVLMAVPENFCAFEEMSLAYLNYAPFHTQFAVF
jgi:hypothetical protein